MPRVKFYPNSESPTSNHCRLVKQTAIELSSNSSNIYQDQGMIDFDYECWCGNADEEKRQLILAELKHKDELNLQDRFGNTLLHFSAIRRHPKCVQMLLNAGATPKIANNVGKTPLHFSVIGLGSDEDDPQCVQILVSHEDTDVNAEYLEEIIYCVPGRKARKCDNTALHSAAFRRLSRCVEILLRAGADPNVRNQRGETPLHYAVQGASRSDFRCVVLLANHRVGDSFVTNVNAQDKNGLTPLHFAAENKCFQSASVLLEREAYLSVKRSKDSRILQKNCLVAVISRFCGKLSFAAKWISTLPTFPFLGNNTNQIIKSRFALPHLLQEMPFLEDNIRARLDKAITYAKDTESVWSSTSGSYPRNEDTEIRSTRPTCRIEIDFRSILPYTDQWFKDSYNDEAVNFNKHEKETEFFADLLKVNRSANKKLLIHPVIAAYMHLKWTQICWFFKFYLLLNTLLACLFTFYCLSVYLIYCPYHARQGIIPESRSQTTTPNPAQEFMQRRIFSWLTFTNGVRKKAQNKICTPDPNDWLFFVVSISLLILTCIVVFDEMYKFVKNWRMYIRTYRNYFQWVTIVCISLTAWPIPPQGLRLHNWQYGAVAYGLFNSWALLLTQIGRFPLPGLYVEMFVQVLKNFGFFIGAYSFLLVAFAIAFCIVFPGYPPFSSIPRAMLKVLTMMSGEVDYQDLFYSNGGDAEKYNTWGRGAEMDLFHPITAHFLYAAFIIIITIVLMNLLVGLAVSDIQGLRKEAELKRISRQIVEISNLENIFFSRRLGCCFETSLGRCLRRRISIAQRLLKNQGIYRFSANSTIKAECLPEELMAKALQLANRNSERLFEKSPTICDICSQRCSKAVQFSSFESSE